MRQIQISLLTVLTALLSIAVIAQTTDCPALVQTALDSIDETCADTGRNQACYGNVSIDLQAQDDAEVEAFENPGDLVALNDISTMTLAPLDETTETWGVALMKLQANVPDTLPGQNVTFLLFGDVVIENAVEDKSEFTPMQAFYFQSGVGDAGCEEAPESGLLIQTPEGVEEILLNVNGANMSLGSTAFLQAGRVEDSEDEFELTISVLEGEGTIEAFDEVRPIPAGSWLRLPADRNFNVIGAPELPRPYQNDRHQRLPIRGLERQFEPQQPLTDNEINQRIEQFNPDMARERLQNLGANLNERRIRGNVRDRLNPDQPTGGNQPLPDNADQRAGDNQPSPDNADQPPTDENQPSANNLDPSPPPDNQQPSRQDQPAASVTDNPPQREEQNRDSGG